MVWEQDVSQAGQRSEDMEKTSGSSARLPNTNMQSDCLKLLAAIV